MKRIPNKIYTCRRNAFSINSIEVDELLQIYTNNDVTAHRHSKQTKNILLLRVWFIFVCQYVFVCLNVSCGGVCIIVKNVGELFLPNSIKMKKIEKAQNIQTIRQIAKKKQEKNSVSEKVKKRKKKLKKN